ncbi:hypothetical protein OROGR_032862 [Orobanche gracilis]
MPTLQRHSQAKKKSNMKSRKAAIKEVNKVQNKDMNKVDRISMLPNDILISIISRLPLREATATSLLSSRWRHLYRYTTRLDLPPFKPDLGSVEQYLQQVQEEKFPKYVRMINRFLDLHMGCGVVKEFRVNVPFLEGADIERWLEFALAREVEIIDINIYGLLICIEEARIGYYRFGLANLIRKNGGKLLPGLKSLNKISLSYIQVDDEELHFLLSNSPSLESLSISQSKRLKNVRIVGRSMLKLKHLDISFSRHIESIEVCDMTNLISLRCYLLPSTYVLKINNVPKLSNFSTRDVYQNTLAEILPTIPSSILGQLQRLDLRTSTGLIRDHPLPELVNVKHLEMKVFMGGTTSHLFSLIEACRSLETVEIELLSRPYLTVTMDGKIWVRPPRKKLSSNLKKLKLSRYVGCNEQLKFAVFIINNVVSLQELIVEVETSDRTRRTMRRPKATTLAYRQLSQIKSASCNLLII